MEFSESDLMRLARLHAECLPESQVSLLGTAGLAEVYRYVSRSPSEVVFVERSADEIVGACTLSSDSRSLARRLLSRAPLWRFLPRLASGASVHSCLDFIDRHVGRERREPRLPDGIPEVVWIFAAPARQGGGVGTRLLAQVEHHLGSRNRSEYIVLVQSTSAKARLFYERNGFEYFSEARRGGRTFAVLRRPLQLPTSASFS